MISHLEALCRAVWLIDLGLRDVRAVNLEPAAAMALALESLGVRDEAAGRSAVERFLKSGPTLLGNVDWLVTALFRLRGGELVIRGDSPVARRVLRIVDPDPLAVFGVARRAGPGDHFSGRVMPMDDGGVISNLLAQGSWETHIHLGGTLPPCFYWLILMGGEMGYESLRWVRSSRRGHAEPGRWERAVTRAAWLRMALAYAVEAAAEKQRIFPHLPSLSAAAWDFWRGGDPPGTLWPLAIRDAVLRLNRERQGEAGRKGEREEGRWEFADPLRGTSSGDGCRHYAEGERRLLSAVRSLLARPRETRGTSAPIEAWALEYLRTRNTFHHVMVHDFGSDGLLRFVETFDRRGFAQGAGQGSRGPRLRRHRLKLERCRMAAALDSQLVDPWDGARHGPLEAPARAIEMRVSVPRGPLIVRTLRAWIEAIAHYFEPAFPGAAGARSRIGLVFHLIKTGQSDAHARRAREDAARLWGVLTDYPGLRPFIVGFDAAGNERLAPPRIFAQAFRSLQNLMEEHRTEPHESPIRLGFTYHVGEDVVDMLSGLRHLDEAASLLLPAEAGGRLGHALALADEPRRFYANRGLQTEPTLGCHLLDLTWAWGRLGDLEEPGGKPTWLFRRLVELAGADSKIELESLARCYEAMGLEGSEGASLSEQELLEKLGFRGDRDVAVPTPADESWWRLLRTLQELLQKRFSLRRITIEANPTSNLVIGGFQGYGELPVAALVEAGLPVSLNTDDPGLFMTSLPGEFAAFYQVWKDKGLPHRKIVSWLQERVVDAAQSTFLIPGISLAPGSQDRDIDVYFRTGR